MLGGTGCKKKPPVEDAVPTPTPVPEDAGKLDVPPAKPESDDVTDIDMQGKEGPLAPVFYDFDQYVIRSDQRPTLEGNARWLLDNSQAKVMIEGHCDERGTEEYNLALGDRRANAARDYLRLNHIPLLEDQRFPDEMVDTIRSVARKLTYSHRWQRGDVLLLDNSRFMHGRKAIVDAGERRIATYFGYLKGIDRREGEPENPIWRRECFVPPDRVQDD